MIAERVLAQHLLHLECQRRKASAHVRAAYREPHSRARRNRDHRRTKASITRRSASPSTSTSTRMRCPLPRSISMMPSLLRRRTDVVDRASATSRARTDGPISSGTNGATLVSPCLQSSYATATAGSHEGAGHASHSETVAPGSNDAAPSRSFPRTGSARLCQTRRPSAETYSIVANSASALPTRLHDPRDMIENNDGLDTTAYAR